MQPEIREEAAWLADFLRMAAEDADDIARNLADEADEVAVHRRRARALRGLARFLAMEMSANG